MKRLYMILLLVVPILMQAKLPEFRDNGQELIFLDNTRRVDENLDTLLRLFAGSENIQAAKGFMFNYQQNTNKILLLNAASALRAFAEEEQIDDANIIQTINETLQKLAELYQLDYERSEPYQELD